jgi:hypothetical protein
MSEGETPTGGSGSGPILDQLAHQMGQLSRRFNTFEASVESLHESLATGITALNDRIDVVEQRPLERDAQVPSACDLPHASAGEASTRHQGSTSTADRQSTDGTRPGFQSPWETLNNENSATHEAKAVYEGLMDKTSASKKDLSLFVQVLCETRTRVPNLTSITLCI